MKFKPNFVGHCNMYISDTCFFFPDMVKIVTLQGRPKSNRKPHLNFDFTVESIGKSGPPPHCGIRVLGFFLMKCCLQFLLCFFKNEKCTVHVSVSEYFIAGKNGVLFVITGLFLVYVY